MPGDKTLPSCTRCARVGRLCVRTEPIRFRNSNLSSKTFYSATPALKAPAHIAFVTECDNGRGSDDINVGCIPGESQGSTADAYHSSVQSSDAVCDPALLPNTASQSLSWPVDNEHEALLMRHFVSVVSHFFDFCDPKRHFARVAPQKSRSSAALANAIFALSARHLSRTSTFDAYVADIYYQRCLQQLIPALDVSVQDESLLVAAVILRLMEEIDVPLTGADRQNHLLGTQAIARAQQHRSSQQHLNGGLLQAAYWAALRQDLYIAFATQQPMVLSALDFFKTLQGRQSDGTSASLNSSEDGNDACYANMAVCQCCDVAQYAFGQGQDDMREYERLNETLLDWRRLRPATFSPFYQMHDTSQSLIPDIRLLMDWHVMGNMYNLLGLILLEMNGPLTGRNSDQFPMNVQWTMREILGIAIHNPNTPSAHLVASMAIAMGGQYLTTDVEAQFMNQILADTERLHGWPTKRAQ